MYDEVNFTISLILYLNFSNAQSVAVVLSIIATKLSAEVYGIELLDPVMSLALVVSVLGVGVGASLAFPVAADSDSDGRL